MRLIDAVELIKNLNDYALQESPNGFESDADKMLQRVIYGTINSCIEAVETQEVAYDLAGVLNRPEEELKLADKEKERCIKENFLQFDSAKGYANGIANAIDYVKNGAKPGGKVRKSPWISVNERVPEDIDRRFFMCLVKNHLEEPPMFCQYEGEYGFGFWKDIYDPVSLGFVDSEFSTMEELGYEKVLYWMPLIEPPEEEKDVDCYQK